MSRYHDATCRDCGATFQSTGYTVRCLDCRHGGKATTDAPKSYKPVACGQCGHVHTTLKCDRCGY